MPPLETVQEMVLKTLQERSVKTVYDLWFKDLTLIDLTTVSAVFAIKSDFKVSILTDRYVDMFQQLMEEVLGFPVIVSFVSTEYGNIPSMTVKPGYFGKDDNIEEPPPNIGPTIESKAVVNKYTFDNFIVGESNKFAHAACLAVASDPFFTYNPLFIHGPSGLGKTHLLFAITNMIKCKKPGIKIVYRRGEDFTNEMINAIQTGTMPKFRDKYRMADVLLVDDIQFIAGKESTQEEFFHTFTALYESEKQIILTSDRPPKDINPLEDRLRTRFEWGLIADIQPPSTELRAAIISKKAEDYRVILPEDAAQYLAVSLNKDIRQIEGVIKRISAMANLTSSKVDIAMCQRVVEDVISGNEPAPITEARIIQVVADRYRLRVEDIKGRRRTDDLVFARQICIYLLRQLTDLPLSSIGLIFKRDHTTVMYAIRRIDELKKSDKEMELNINQLIAQIRSE
ncbi:MAG: chromosomal replication initiator protein DnaA [Clostridia bacterium]|nr:chromosomal replication initiator protein DnaA [Clostridia bacterium]